MAVDSGSNAKVEIAHVLTMDVVEYSTLLITEQSRIMTELKGVVRNTAHFRRAEAEGKLICLPTGDGMLLVFFDNLEAPIECAMEISAAIKSHPEIRLRMGIHSGPVNQVLDVNNRSNVAGAGVDMAQRVMDCGDAGHILLSKRVAEDLAPFPRWNPHLHDLGECEVKHGRKVSLVNFYTDNFGNASVPGKLRNRRRAITGSALWRRAAPLAGMALVIIAIASVLIIPHLRRTDALAGEKSIAVLPFVNQNNDPGTEYLSDGIPESIINSLSQLPNLKVMSRNSVFRYKGKDADAQTVAKDLKVQAMLTGRVAQRADSLSISVELVNVLDGRQIWGQQYNRRLADVFALQEEMAKTISEKLRLKLTGAERQQLAKRPTENIKAFQYYMQGRSYTQRRTREDLLTAIRYCERAIEEDPNYALAYAGLADAYASLGVYNYIAPIEGRRKAEETARKALTFDENLAEAYAALGFAHTIFAPSSFSLGDGELRRAIQLSPSLAVAHLNLGVSLVRQGRLDEGLEEFLRGRELDPLSSIIARAVALPYYVKRDYVQALELLRQANELGPAFSTTFEIGVYIQNRLFNETFAELEKAKRERKDDPILIYGTGMVYAAQGKRAEALQIIKELEEMSGASLSQAHYIAKIYATLNEKEMAFSWLERGLATGAIGAFYKDEPVWDTIRNDPRFADLLRLVGLPQ